MTGNPRESGATLVMALLLMTAAVFLGISYAASATQQLAMRQADLERAQAESLAEGLLDTAYYYLRKDPNYAGTLKLSYGAGDATATITQVGNLAQIVSVGEVNGRQAGYYSRARVRATVPVKSTIQLGGNLTLASSQVRWGGQLVRGGTVSVDGDSDLRGNARQAAVSPIAIDTAPYIAAHDLLVPDETSIASGAFSGTIYGQQDFRFEASQKLSGITVTEGTLTVEGRGTQSVYLEAGGDDQTVLLIRGNLIFTDLQTLLIQGTVVVEGSVLFQNVGEAYHFGSLIVNGSIQVTGSQLSFEYDPTILKLPPANVTAAKSGDAALNQLWRRPFTGSAP